MENLLSHTFEAQMFPDSEWAVSVGRWDTIELAANAASEWLMMCAKGGTRGGVRLVQVLEWDLLK